MSDRRQRLTARIHSNLPLGIAYATWRVFAAKASFVGIRGVYAIAMTR
jgi:hypothetical protein